MKGNAIKEYRAFRKQLDNYDDVLWFDIISDVEACKYDKAISRVKDRCRLAEELIQTIEKFKEQDNER